MFVGIDAHDNDAHRERVTAVAKLLLIILSIAKYMFAFKWAAGTRQ